MKIYGKLKSIQGGKLTIETDNNISFKRVGKFANKGPAEVEIDIQDGRTITPDQRKKIYAMFNDLSRWSGFLPEETKQYMKNEFYMETNADEFSLSDVSVERASEFIKWLLEFMFKWNVPFKGKAVELSEDINNYLWLCLKYRKCAVCGKKGEIHHQDNRVGVGRNRTKFDHRHSTFICLCRKHHNEIHTMGIKEMVDKYKIKPIKVNEDGIIELGLMSRKRINELNSKGG